MPGFNPPQPTQKTYKRATVFVAVAVLVLISLMVML
jgi:hypothetical protein